MAIQGGIEHHLTFVIHDVEGGVASMNQQILENADFNKNFKVHIILWRAREEKNKVFTGSFLKAETVSRFSFSLLDNYFLTLKKFNQVLNLRQGLIVTNDGIELESIRKFGTNSVLYSIVHDFYNLKLALENIDLVDYFICHTETFFRAITSNPALSERASFLIHGVKLSETIIRNQNNNVGHLTILSVSRLIESKGVMLFYLIDDILLKKGIKVKWLVVGSGELEGQIKEQWKYKSNIEFFNPDSQEKVYGILKKGDIFISPSKFEGYGISLLEAMSCRLVPVIYRLPVGIYSDLPGHIGFSLPVNDLNGLAESIAILNQDRKLLADMGNNAYQFVATKYDISNTANQYLNFFRKSNTSKINRAVRYRNYDNPGILDRSYIPNFITRLVKKWRART